MNDLDMTVKNARAVALVRQGLTPRVVEQCMHDSMSMDFACKKFGPSGVDRDTIEQLAGQWGIDNGKQ